MAKSDKEEIRNKANELGEAVSRTAAFEELRNVHEKVADDEEAKQILKDHRKAAFRVRELEQKGEPIEVEDKRTVQDTREKMHSNKLLGQYVRAQADFQEIMNIALDSVYSQIQLQPFLTDEEESE